MFKLGDYTYRLHLLVYLIHYAQMVHLISKFVFECQIDMYEIKDNIYFQMAQGGMFFFTFRPNSPFILAVRNVQ